MAKNNAGNLSKLLAGEQAPPVEGAEGEQPGETVTQETGDAGENVEGAAPPEQEQEVVKANSDLPEIGSKTFVYNPGSRPLRDPYTTDYFPPGKTIRVRELGSWTHCQLEAKLLRVGKAEDVGAEPEDNSDFIEDAKKSDKK